MPGLRSWTVISKYALATEMHKLDWSPASTCPRFLGGDKCFNLFLWSPMHYCSSCPSRALNAPSGIFHIHIEIVWSSASTCLGFVHCFFPFLRSGIIHKFTLSVGWDGFCTCKLIQNKRWEERDARHLLHEGGWIDCLLLLVHITCFLQLLLHIHHHAPSSSSLKKKCRIQKTSLPKSQRMLVQLELIFNF